MRPRFVGRLGPADLVSVANAGLGLVAVVAATVDPRLAARVVLLAAMGDGLDGVVARRYGGSEVGEFVDSLSDVAAFGVAPAALVIATARGDWGLAISPSPALALAVGVGVAFLAVVIVRLAFYTADYAGSHRTEGVPSTLAATILAAGVLTAVPGATAIVAGAAVLSYLMIAGITYPDLLARDALLMGVVHGLAVLFPSAFGRAFPYALLTLALAYLALAPRFYWGPDERGEGKRS